MNSLWFLWNIMNVSWTSYELLKNFSQTFWKHLAILLWTSHQFLTNFMTFLWACELIDELLANFLLISCKLLVNFLPTYPVLLTKTYKLLMNILNFLTNAYILMEKLFTKVYKILQTSYKLFTKSSYLQSWYKQWLIKFKT